MNAVFRALPTALVILKPNGSEFIVEDVNNLFQKLADVERDDILYKSFFEIFSKYTSDHKRQIDEIRSAMQISALKNQNTETGILEFDVNDDYPSDKETLYLQFKCSPVLGGNDSMDLIILAIEDISDLLTNQEKEMSGTKRVKTRKELHDLSQNLADRAATSKAQYESASQELDDFVYSVSHDLRAPLRRIDGFSQELLNEYADKLDETGAHYLKRIRQGAQDMGQLIDDLLKLSRISRKSVDREEFDLGKIAETIFDELTELEPERKVEFKIDDNLKVEADKGLVKAMLANLISNALKFSSNNEKTKIHLGSTMTDGEKVFYISDNGVGFDPSYSHKLFKAFSRLHSHNQFSGTGIGLATVKRVMTLHGGTIWAESSEGKGATFYFKF